MVYALKIKKKDAEKIRKKLVKEKLLSSQWNIEYDGKFVYFPLERYIEGAVEFEFEKRRRKKSPYERILEKLRESGVENGGIPDYWERIGDVVLLPPFTCGEKIQKLVGEAFAEVLSAKTVAINHGIQGEFRKPKIEIIYGWDTETVHIENGIKYKLDVGKVMFSSGNVDERIRMGKINAKDETVVDMFAGIGYFTLPIALYGHPKKVYACEKNPTAYYYLLENIRINGANNVVPLFGDNRKVSPLGIADRVIMGYIRTEKFLEWGVRILRSEGGIIHYHDTFKKEEMDYLPEKNVEDVSARYGFSVRILNKRIVKSYAPRIYHVALDVKLEKY